MKPTTPKAATALLVIDVQNDFMEGGALAVPDAAAILPAVNDRITSADYQLVIATQDMHPENHVSFGLWPVHCVQATLGAALHPKLFADRIDVIWRKGLNPSVDSYGAFFDNTGGTTHLAELLKAKGITAVDVVGLATDYCVGTTALQAAPLFKTRVLVSALRRHRIAAPVWIRNTEANAVDAGAPNDFPSRLIEASMLSGALFCEGIGDLISVETTPTPAKSLVLAYDILQGARMRVSKTEYVACPSCGRTLFDIQATTLKIKARTGHLKGVTIAVMGCIVNGPGEMADADFGYVGGAPGKINLYVRRECVKFGIPQAEAVDRLVDLIKEHGKWFEPDAT